MGADATLSVLVVLLLAMPLAAAVSVALLGSRQAAAVRWFSLAATVINLVLAVILAVQFGRRRHEQDMADAGAGPAGRTELYPTFRPEFVPGSPPDRPHATTWNLLQLGKEPAEAVQFYVGLDGLNVGLVVLTAVLMVSSVLVSWNAIGERVAEFYAWLLVLQTGMQGVFLAFDIVLFYAFFELTLVPLFFVIGIWGGPQRRYAARKFFIYTLAGSLITLLGVIGAILACRSTTQELTFSIPRLVQNVQSRLAVARHDPAGFEYRFWAATPQVGKILRAAVGLAPPEEGMWGGVEFWIFLALMTGFAVKVPLVPLHTWLPLAHVEAPTAGSVLLAGVLLKIGAYGFLRLCLPLAPDASLGLGVPLVGTLAVIGVVYGSLCALGQHDIKKLVAYSSVGHMGFVMLGMFALNATGLSGSLLQMINHGLSTGALFLLVGMLYERYHTRLMQDYGGMGKRLPLLACMTVFICLTSIGLPGLNGFVGEVLVLMGIFDFEQAPGRWPALAVVGATGLVLSAWYLLTMVQRVFYGPVKEPHLGPEHAGDAPVRDLGLRELAALAPIALLCVAIGVYPQPFLKAIARDVGVVDHIVDPGRSNRVPTAVPSTSGEKAP